MEGVRELARAEKRTLSEVVNELLVDGVQRRRRRSADSKFELPSFSMGKPRGNLADRDTLEALMEN